ncbi:hypothetical protein V2J09_014886 [Rumex salicifolius]
MTIIPETEINSGRRMPIIGFGTAGSPNAGVIKAAVLDAIKIGYRHFDTAFSYGSEKALGEAVTEATRDGLIKSRDELFITTKLWCTFAQRHLVVPAINMSLQNLKMEYVDLYLVHFPVKLRPEARTPPFPDEYVEALDVKSVWEGMEECHRLGLAKSIGVSNFSVEMNPMWQQRELREFCKNKGIHVTAYCVLGANNTKWGDNRILGSESIQEIAQARGKTVAQVAIRWVYEQGVSLVVKSFTKERMEENLQIFDWSLTNDECENILELPQRKGVLISHLMGPHKILLEIDQGMIPEIELSLKGVRTMPLIGLGTAGHAGATKSAVIEAIKVGYRHFDTAFLYGSEEALGEAVAEAVRDGLIKSRDELFITSKLWCTFADRDLVVPAIKTSLESLKMDYVDLYLVHLPLKLSPEARQNPFPDEYIHPFDAKSVWEGMEECYRLGLANSIGVSNFSVQKLQQVLQIATIPPVVNQVEINPMWQQFELREFCKQKGIHVTAYSPLGANNTNWGDDRILTSAVLQEIAQSKGKTIAQVALRWVYEQGVSLVVKSVKRERMEENLQILDWSLTKEELEKISMIPQRKGCLVFGSFGTHKLLLEIDQGV